MTQHKYTGIFWRFMQEWTQIFERDRDVFGFHPFVLEAKWERDRGGVELTAFLMGFGVGVRYNYAETALVVKEREAMEKMVAFMAQMERDQTGASVQ